LLEDVVSLIEPPVTPVQHHPDALWRRIRLIPFTSGFRQFGNPAPEIAKQIKHEVPTRTIKRCAACVAPKYEDKKKKVPKQDKDVYCLTCFKQY